MTQDEIIKLIETNGLTLHGDIEHFAELVAAQEREACAKLCDYYYKSWINIEGRYEFMGEGAQECAEAIRARGEV